MEVVEFFSRSLGLRELINEWLQIFGSKAGHTFAPPPVVLQPYHELIVDIIDDFGCFSVETISVIELEKRVMHICIVKEDEGLQKAEFPL